MGFSSRLKSILLHLPPWQISGLNWQFLKTTLQDVECQKNLQRGNPKVAPILDRDTDSALQAKS